MVTTLKAIADKNIPSDSSWNRVKFPANYSHRDSTRIFEHKGILYMSNGYQPGAISNKDLWKSDDAIEWEIVNINTPYTAWCPIISFKNEIVALGASIMKSLDDGLSFQTVLSNPPFSITANTRRTWWPIVYEDKLVLIGAGKVWWTTDLISWSSKDIFFNRENYAIWQKDGLIFVAAGSQAIPAATPEAGYPDSTSFNDVWSTDDPINGNWSRLLINAPWAKRLWPAFTTHNGEMYISGGYNNVTGLTNFDDTWASKDGVIWREVGVSVKYGPRHYSQLVSRHGRLILNNGNRNPNVSPGTINDIWELS